MKLYLGDGKDPVEIILNILLYICALGLAFTLFMAGSLIVHSIRYKCIRGHHGWVTHHSAKLGTHTYWEFICDEEVLKSDTTKHIIYDNCNCR
jgi:hypothetical protein